MPVLAAARLRARRATRLVAATCVLVALLHVSAPASAGPDALTYGYPNAGYPLRATPAAGGCDLSVKIYIMENGSSGVKRMKAQFQLRAPYDPYIPGLAYAVTGWITSTEFADDQVSHYHWYELPPGYPGFRIAYNKQYAVWVKVHAETSYWFPRKKKWKLGTVGCPLEYQTGDT